MRNLICFLSEIDQYKNNEIYRSVLFEAAEKLRVFGYIKGVNKISLNEFADDSIYDIKHQTIQNYYSSKVFRNNLLDKKQKDIIDTFMSLEKNVFLLVRRLLLEKHLFYVKFCFLIWTNIKISCLSFLRLLY